MPAGIGRKNQVELECQEWNHYNYRTMNEQQQTAIYLTNEEAELFKCFRQFQDEFLILKTNGVFNLRNGRVIIHKDSDGKCRKIEVENVTYIKK